MVLVELKKKKKNGSFTSVSVIEKNGSLSFDFDLVIFLMIVYDI